MTRRSLMLVAAAGSAGLLIGAFLFQYVGGLAPCKMCLWQRWPHAAAIALGAMAAIVPAPLLAWLGAVAALTTAGIGGYHTGVERGWWEGPSGCTGGGPGVTGLSGDQLLSTEGHAGIVMCDEVVWSLAGLSMASWNMIIALALAGVWIAAARAKA